MPNRMLRDWTMSDKINTISMQAERFFTRLIMKVDDHGCFYADPRVLKANLFPLLLDTVREADLLRWMAECQKAGLIVLYEHASKKYVQILDFRQRLDRAKSKYPLPTDIELPAVVNDFPPEIGTGKEVEPERKDSPSGDGAPAATPPDPKEVFKRIKKEKKPLYEFIRAHRPDFIEPYMELWNIFARERGKPLISKISEVRKKKFHIRIREKSFDFLGVLIKAGAAGDFLSASKWFTWDWIMDSEQNYLKVLEGNYDANRATGKLGQSPKPSLAGLNKDELEINYLFEQSLEGLVTVISIEPQHYHTLKKAGHAHFTEAELLALEDQAKRHLQEKGIDLTDDKLTAFKKRFAVLEIFRKLQETGVQTIFHLPNHAHATVPATTG